MTDLRGNVYPWAPGFVEGDRPMIVTSRLRYEDSYTLERYLATERLRRAARRARQAGAGRPRPR